MANSNESSLVPSLLNAQTALPRVSFLIAGVQKAGTTALARFLSTHPDVFMPDDEIHYFDNDLIDWDGPYYALYERDFSAAEPHQTVGEKKFETQPPTREDQSYAYDLLSDDTVSTSALTCLDLSHWRRS